MDDVLRRCVTWRSANVNDRSCLPHDRTCWNIGSLWPSSESDDEHEKHSSFSEGPPIRWKIYRPAADRHFIRSPDTQVVTGSADLHSSTTSWSTGAHKKNHAAATRYEFDIEISTVGLIGGLTSHYLIHRSSIGSSEEYCMSARSVNPLMATLKLHSNGLLHSNTVIGTLAVDVWSVTFGTARRGLGGLGPRPVRYSLYQM